MKTEPAALTSANIVAFISGIFDRSHDAYLGEQVTMPQHMLQGATIAQEQGMADEVVVGALLHDIGHFAPEFGTFAMSDTRDRYHEQLGARLLSDFFPRVILDCVRYHVAAKRYLCATRPEYFSRLSEASVHSLKLQGGPMSDEEVAEFERLPHLEAIIQVRYLDEAGKDPKMTTPDFAHFAPLVQQFVNLHSGEHR
ncbi:phosphodiesterase [Marinobacterium nitratireducens]|uniref:Phosphodiesterase n=1 Tax=Marinobacterium nitratireducens TaxID=518897 RepID=A0A917Z7Z6_9GAMM|nr:HD domain-containing protein [Marinobacterium nitratireducens]GGO75385.1 phosphodiesterase [Marinobacterium nitratireducens]